MKQKKILTEFAEDVVKHYHDYHREHSGYLWKAWEEAQALIDGYDKLEVSQVAEMIDTHDVVYHEERTRTLCNIKSLSNVRGRLWVAHCEGDKVVQIDSEVDKLFAKARPRSESKKSNHAEKENSEE